MALWITYCNNCITYLNGSLELISLRRLCQPRGVTTQPNHRRIVLVLQEIIISAVFDCNLKTLKYFLDIDECIHASKGNCQQLCINTPGSWKCGCEEGYRRRSDDPYSCEPVCSVPCLNNGVCVKPNRCFCPPGYPGPDCTGSKKAFKST